MRGDLVKVQAFLCIIGITNFSNIHLQMSDASYSETLRLPLSMANQTLESPIVSHSSKKGQ